MEKHIIGELVKKDFYNGDNETHPAGYFTIGGLSFSLWDTKVFNHLELGKEYTVTYTEKELNGKIYYNAHSVDSVNEMDNYVDEEKIEFSDKEKGELEKVGINTSDLRGPKNEIILKEGEIVISGFKYRVEPAKLILIN